MRLILTALALVIAGVLATGCDVQSTTDKDGGDKPRVVATTTMIGDLVTRIAGDKVALKVIMGAGVDPHTFKPSTSDLGELSRAKLVLYNGLHLEGKMVELFERRLKDRAVAVTKDVPESRLLAWKAGDGGAHDPHVWFDVSLWSIAAGTVGDALANADPANAAEYRERTTQLQASMAELDRYARSKVAEVPEARRVLVTSHDAYNYFGRAYGIEVRGLQGISTETEAGLANIRGAVDYIIARKIPAIFVESSVSHKTIEQVQADCRARGFDVKVGGELYSDAMGSPGEHQGYAVETYDGMVRYNVDTLAHALKGAVTP